MPKKLSALLLAIILILGLAACNQGGASPSAQPTSAASTAPQDNTPANNQTQPDPAASAKEFTLMLQEFEGAPIAADMMIFQQFTQDTGVTFKVLNIPGNEYADKVQVTLASGDLPDMVETAQIDVNEYINAGTFVPIDDALASSGQNILRRYEQLNAIDQVRHSDGNIYKIPNLTERVFYLNNLINKTWLDELNLAMPTTMDELYDVLVTFRDSAGTGSIPQGIIPFANGSYCGGWNSAVNMVKKSHGLRSSGFGEYEEGVLFPPYQMQDRYKAALEWSAKLYADGLFDPQMFSISEDEISAKYSNNMYGFMSSWGDTLGSSNADWVAAPVMSTAFGEGKELQSTPITTYHMITKSCSDVTGLVGALDYFFTDEGIELTNWGTEGVTYTLENGEKHFTSLILDHENGATRGRYVLGMVAPHFPSFLSKDAEYELKGTSLSEIETYVDGKLFPLEAPLVPTREESSEFTQIMTDISKYVSEQEPLFIRGELNFQEDFDAFVAQIEKMNIQRAIEIKEAQYNRFYNPQ